MNDHTYTLTYGSHASREDGMCLMEAVAYLAGEPHTDAPACACPVLTAFAVRLNDAMGTGPDGDALRARYLHDLAPMLVGSRSTPEVEQVRAYVLADHAVRVFAPLALEAAWPAQAKRLRALQPITDQASAEAAQVAARAAAWAAAGGAGAAARAAAWDAARAAAGAAAGDAAGAAAWDAAREALVAALEAAP